MGYADKPLDQNPYWNSAYFLRFAYEYAHTAFVLDRAHQPAEHYRRMAERQMRDAAAALGFDLVERQIAAPDEATVRCTVVAQPFARVA